MYNPDGFLLTWRVYAILLIYQISMPWILYWSKVNLQCCVSYRCTAQKFSYIFMYTHTHTHTLGFSGGSDSKKLVQEPWVHSLGWADPLEKGMATHSRILAWSVPWTEVPGEASAWGWKVRHDWVTNTSTFHIYLLVLVFLSQNLFPYKLLIKYGAAFPLLSSRSLLVIYFIYSSVYLIIPTPRTL